MLYSHDTMGLGHLRRNQLIALAITRAVPGSKVLLVAGVPHATCLEFPDGVDCLTLPSMGKTNDGKYGARSLGMSVDELTKLRAASIHAAVRSFDPDLLVVDKAPRGACGELDATLEWIKRRGSARCVLGFRDVLDEPEAVARDWREGCLQYAVDQFYDEIWVYGDRQVNDLAAEYDWPTQTSAKLRYLGYLDQRARVDDGAAPPRQKAAAASPNSIDVCSVGGGQDGYPLALAFVQADFPAGGHGVVVTGPYMPRDLRHSLERFATRNPRLQVVEFLPEADLLVRSARRLVTMGGYNSVCAALSFGTPALVVPRIKPRREQAIRAERLGALGLLDWFDPDELTPGAISEWLAKPTPQRPDASNVVDMNGLERLGVLAGELSHTDKACVHG